MWVIRLILLLLVLIVLVYVVAANLGQTVDLDFFGRDYPDTPVFYVAAGCFALGFLIALVAMGLREWRLRRDLGRQAKRAGALEKELADLRALPLRELSEREETRD